MKKIALAILVITGLVMLAACGGSSAPPAAPSPAPMSSDASPPMIAQETAAPASAAPAADNSADYGELAFGDSSGGYEAPELSGSVETRKVVYSAEYRLETEDFNGTIQRLEQKIALSGSYIQQSDSRAATEYSPAYASLNIRVPAAMYGDFNTFLNNLANLVSSNKHGEDVTAQYFDTEARLKVLQAQEERIMAFIANSKDLDEIFKIERELTRISTEIEQLTTVKNRLDNLTAYATVYVEIYETLPEDGTLLVEQDVFSARVQHALDGSLKALVTVAQGFVLLLIWLWPLLIILVLALFVWHKLGKGRRNKAAPFTLPEEQPKEDEK